MRTSPWVAGALAACLVLLPIRLAAQSPAPDAPSRADDPLTELPLEELLKVKVYAASKFVQDVAHAPASVTIVTAAEIRNHGYRTLADILRSVRGFYVTYDRSYSYIGSRGFSRPGDYNTRVLLLLNGQRLNDNVFEQALLGTESPIDVRAIDRVEVVRGPSSSLYGTSAFFGVINIVTKSGRAMNGVEIDGLIGSQRSFSGNVTTGGTRHGFDGLVSVSASDSRGNRTLYFPEFDSPATSNGVAHDADGDESASLFAGAAVGGLKLQGGYGTRTKTIPTASFETLFDDDRETTSDSHGFVGAQYNRALENKRTTIDLRGAFDRYRYDGTFPYEVGTGSLARTFGATESYLFDDRARGAWLTAEGAVVHQFDRHGVTAGLEYRDHLQQDQYAADDAGVVLDDQRSSRTTGLYAEDEFRVRPGLVVNGGLRWDHYYEMFGGTVNPRLAVIVSPTERSSLKALYGRAFRAPNPFELYYDQNVLSATLKPERISTYELVWEQLLRSNVHATASLFHYRATDLIVQRSGSDTIDGLYFQNLDTANATGAEFEVQFDLARRIQGRLAYSTQSATDAATGDVLTNSPRHLGMFALDAPLGSTGLLAAFDGHVIGERRTVSGADVPGTVVANFTVSRPVRARGLGVALSIRNLFGADHADPASFEHTQRMIPQDGPSVALRATWRF